ncbi:MAG: MBL fold metallo-hydrolase [Chloroflexota bacterium]
MLIDDIKWLGHGGFMIQASKLLVLNPWRVVRSAFHADIILLTHEHYDHCSTADIEKLRGPHTKVIGNEAVAAKITNTTIIRPWQSMSFERMSIKAIPAYAPDGITHKLEDGGLGFVISVNFYDIYYAGDTKIIPEMERIRPDVALLPIDNRDTMGVDEAVEAVALLSPRWVMPFNWGSVGEGATRLDAQEFKSKVGGQAEVILPNNSTETSST